MEKHQETQAQNFQLEKSGTNSGRIHTKDISLRKKESNKTRKSDKEEEDEEEDNNRNLKHRKPKPNEQNDHRIKNPKSSPPTVPFNSLHYIHSIGLINDFSFNIILS